MNTYKKNGSLRVVCGSMFSGKSEELIRSMRRAHFARQEVQVFKHSFDIRKTLTNVHTHNGGIIPAASVSNAQMILELLSPSVQVIGIDEVQFFDNNIILVIDQLVREGKNITVAGLDLDFRGIPFGPMPTLLALADEVLKLKAVCSKNGTDAHFTQRIINNNPASHSDPIVLIGAQDCYEARSRDSYEIDYIPLNEYVQSLATL